MHERDGLRVQCVYCRQVSGNAQWRFVLLHVSGHRSLRLAGDVQQSGQRTMFRVRVRILRRQQRPVVGLHDVLTDRALHECAYLQQCGQVRVHELRSRLLPLGRWLGVRSVQRHQRLRVAGDVHQRDERAVHGVRSGNVPPGWSAGLVSAVHGSAELRLEHFLHQRVDVAVHGLRERFLPEQQRSGIRVYDVYTCAALRERAHVQRRRYIGMYEL